MLAITWSSPATLKSPFVSVFLGAVCDINQSLFSAHLRPVKGNSVMGEASTEPDMDDDEFCMQRFKGRRLTIESLSFSSGSHFQCRPHKLHPEG